MAQNGSPMAMSTSPAPQPMSKRDRKRTHITEKLADMVSTFADGQHQHYRAQLQAIQLDMTLIIRADPYENAPVDDSPQAIEERIDSVTGGNVPSDPAAKDDYLAMAGKQYYEYAQQINRAMEQRDADLTSLKNHYDSANIELDRAHAYKIQIAQREHLELASTIRQRLINTVTKKRDKLLREKEQLDIADSSALFMHPSQFSINVPNSPGGIQSHRKTRHTRHRAGEAEEGIERGRKRRAVGDDDGTDSPAPSFRPLANDVTGASSPFHESRAKTLYRQYEAPAFSIDRLFSDKELAHASTVAQFATHHVFHQEQQTQESAEQITNGHAPSVPSLDGSAEAGVAAAVAHVEALDAAGIAPSSDTPPPSQAEAVGMERTISYHATRGAAKANPLSFLSDAAAAVSSNPALSNPFMPALVPITKTDKGAPTPPGMNGFDVDNDISLMLRDEDEISMKYDGEEKDPNSLGAIRDRFLEQACRDQTGVQPFRLPLTEVGPATIKGGAVLRPPHYGFADPDSVASSLRNGAAGTAPTSTANLNSLAAALGGSLGGMPMSRATSMGGSEIGAPSEAGGGGVGMRRTRSRLI